MPEHYPRSTVSAEAWCAKCKKRTQHRIDDARIGPCLECIAALESRHTESAFTLEAPGPKAPCGFPRCTLEAFHEGEHEFPAPPAQKHDARDIRVCSECGTRFVVYGEFVREEARTCGSQACILARVSRDIAPIPLACSCPQRPYPHELSVHAELRSESFNPRLRQRWPWVLCAGENVGPLDPPKKEKQ